MSNWRNIPTEYQDQITAGEASAMLATLPDNCIDFWLTSPPYDDLRSYNGYRFEFAPIARELYRVTKPGGVGVWVVSDQTKDGSESGTSFRQALGFMDVGFNLHDTMIYEVAGTGAKGSNLAYWQGFEYMFVVSKGRPATVNRLQDKPNKWRGMSRSGGQKSKVLNSRTETNHSRTIPENSVRTNVWRYHTGKTKGFSQRTFNADESHEAPFPEALARDHILSWSNPGEIVLDPMIGSGTTAKIARQLHRRFVGFEISPEYVALARRRLSAVQVMFGELV